ncbi:Thioredoxin-dependent peroxide reductase [Chlorella sorokiniana]|uniref:thioredoxin-dependent peroxiredoxin n=1 Tax=Chlorella sorokiniana TaxID=3076 RepID=A0A2P6TYP3_CHLSO|nr:Thioredoxin-dependent peroxide reductase [Chlorella sorokiniana]|eukprot:PRW59160.1 Thioredoxin-dependent peroxide reductase [Chlorella sorokiniana]
MRRAMARTLCRLAQTSEGLAAQAARPAAIGLLGAVETATKAAAAVPVRTVSTSAPSFAAETEYSNAVFYPEPEVEVGEAAPAFSLPAIVNGEVKQVSLDDYKGKYVILFFYPKDFTFVCPTEIIAFSDRAKEFEALNCQLLAASTDTPEVHLAWIKTARKRGGLGFMQIPILADVTKAVSARYGVLKRDAGIALRGLYIINPEGVLEHITVNNFPIGRNVDEALRMLQAIQYVAEHGEVCPAGWKPGEKTMVADPEKSLDYFSTVGGDEEEEKESGKLLKIRTKKDLDALVQSGKKAVIKFWAPWCNKCRMIAPHVEELADKHKGVTVASFDTTADELETLTAELGVKGLPQFRFYKDGKETMDKIMGYKLAPLSEAFAKLDKL